eukprot:scaffold6986_cov190-Amphora_coffeaeformis.AAC.5
MRNPTVRACLFFLSVPFRASIAFHPVPSSRVVVVTSKSACRASLGPLGGDEAEKSSIVEYDDFLPGPNPDLDAMGVLAACMDTMLDREEDGLEVCWRFSSDRCRAALGGSLERFSEYATNPVFGYLVKCLNYEILNIGPIIHGTPTRGDMQTILMDAKQSDDKVEEHPRRFLWTFQKERRPPRQGCWVVHEVIYVKNAYSLTL